MGLLFFKEIVFFWLLNFIVIEINFFNLLIFLKKDWDSRWTSSSDTGNPPPHQQHSQCGHPDALRGPRCGDPDNQRWRHELRKQVTFVQSCHSHHPWPHGLFTSLQWGRLGLWESRERYSSFFFSQNYTVNGINIKSRWTVCNIELKLKSDLGFKYSLTACTCMILYVKYQYLEYYG